MAKEWSGSGLDLNFGAIQTDGIIFATDQLIVGIDPKQEAKLVGLDSAVPLSDTSDYFNSANTNVPVQDSQYENLFHIPVLLNENSFSNHKYKVNLEKLDVPFVTNDEQQKSAQKIRKSGGSKYLKGVDVKPIDTYTITGKGLENIYFDKLKKPDANPLIEVGGGQLVLEPNTLTYQRTKSPFPKRWDISYQLANEPVTIDENILQKDHFSPYVFRQPEVIEHETNEMGVPVLPALDLNIIGHYDTSKLQVSKDPLTKLPLQTYRPAEATIVLGPDNEPLNPVQKLKGSGSPTSLLTNPPNLLTTVKAAEKVMGGDSISSIRVKVEGIEEIGNASQKKLEAVKQEIEETTGLQVTITRGSSPQPTVTKIVNKGETEGWMEQTWIHIGASITILRESTLGYSSVLVAVLLIGIMYVLATTYVSFLTNRKDYSIFLALGWRTGMLRKIIVLEAISYVILISTLALAAEYILSLNGADFHATKVGLVALTSFFIYGFGILLPLIQVGRIKPYQGIKSGEIGSKSKRLLKNKSIIGLVINQVMQRPGRNLLSILAIALPSTLLSFYLFVSIRLDGILYTSYLGEFVAVEVNESHYFIMAAALFIGVLTTAEMMWQNIVERQNELALFKSIGWRNNTVGLSIVLKEH